MSSKAAREARIHAHGAPREHLGIDCITVVADWDAHGNAAGPIRNTRMLDEKPDIGLGFHDDIARSKGTKDMLAKLKRASVPHILITHHEDYRPELNALLRDWREGRGSNAQGLFTSTP